MNNNPAQRMFFFAAALLLAPACLAQKQLSGVAETKLALDRLPVTGSVLMIAAHPDDENTAVLAYFARGQKMRTAYLALNRGEGGQNLIGSEQGADIGLIRTQELLAARRIDGAEQFFTRAIDFGFSKTAEETRQKWGGDTVLADVVWVIRNYRPDIIINRFSGTTRDGHGNHQLSAILSKEAFRAAADPARFPEQLRYVKPWQAKRLFWNVFSFTREQEQAASQLKDPLKIDSGQYSPLLGFSYTEIAGMSRSMHKSQSMGSRESKGEQINLLVLVDGEPAKSDPFEGVDTTWSRVPNGAAVGTLLEQARREFNPEQPQKTIPTLLKARAAMAGMEDPIAIRKRRELDEAVALCAGLWADASSDRFQAAPGGQLKLNFQSIVRSSYPVTLAGVKVQGAGNESAVPLTAAQLPSNKMDTKSIQLQVPATQAYTQPYWLMKPNDGNLYAVEDQRQIGKPESDPAMRAVFQYSVDGQTIELTRPLQYRFVDPVDGESIRPLAIVPPVAVQLPEKAFLFPSPQPRTIEVLATSNIAKAEGEVRLIVPAGWTVTPAAQKVLFAEENEKKTLAFQVTPPARETRGELRAEAVINGQTSSAGMEIIKHSHIPPITTFPSPRAALIREDVKVTAKRVGYVMGAGDEMPNAIRQLGVDVTLLTADDLASSPLNRFDAIVAGVRAFNTRPDLRANMQRVLDYVQQGGTFVAQYNVLEGGFMSGNPKNTDKMGPYPFSISRDRVTVEEAQVSFPNPQSPVLRTPNAITSKDFEGWVQERGLYFPSKWDSRYQPLFAAHDPGDQDMAGGTLYARYGKGAYIYTAYAWFRQLPAGVPGSYRIFANFLSAGKAGQEQASATTP